MAVSTLGSGITPVAGSRNLASITDGITYTFSTGLTLSGQTVTTNDSEISHDSLSGFVAAEHIDWTGDAGASNIHINNITEGAITQHEAAIDHDALTNFVANEHIDWTSTTETLSTSGDIECESLTLGTGPTVDEIEISLTNSVYVIPTSSAVYAHVNSAISSEVLSLSGVVQYTKTTIDAGDVGSTVTLATLPANSMLLEIKVYITTLFDSTSNDDTLELGKDADNDYFDSAIDILAGSGSTGWQTLGFIAEPAEEDPYTSSTIITATHGSGNEDSVVGEVDVYVKYVSF